MKKYTEYEKIVINKKIAHLSVDEGTQFSSVYEKEKENHGFGIAASFFSLYCIPLLYFGFKKFNPWISICSIITPILTFYIFLITLFAPEPYFYSFFYDVLVPSFRIILSFISAALQFYFFHKTWNLIENMNYTLKEKLLLSIQQ